MELINFQKEVIEAWQIGVLLATGKNIDFSLEDFLISQGGEIIEESNNGLITVKKLGYNSFQVIVPKTNTIEGRNEYLSIAISILLIKMGYCYEHNYSSFMELNWVDLEINHTCSVSKNFSEETFTKFKNLFLS